MLSTTAERIHALLGIYHIYFISYATIWDVQHPNYMTYAGRWKTLSFVSCMVNCWYFIGVFALDTLKPVLPQCVANKLKKFFDTMWASIVCPAALVVVAAFWAMFYINRSMIWPAAMDELIPKTYAHMMHTVLAVTALIEMTFVYHEYPRYITGLLLGGLYAGGYVAWIYVVRYMSRVWPYPIFYKMSEKQRAGFIGVVVVLFLALYTAQFIFHFMLWRSHSEVKKSVNTGRKGSPKKVM